MNEVDSSAGLELAATLRMLSIGFSPPDPETLEQLRRLTVLSARHARDDGLAELLVALEQELDDDELLDELSSEYEALFGGAVRCSPYEGSYEADPFRHTRQMADIEGFYRAFGAVSRGPAAERPDHAGCELEFLSFLIAKRVGAEMDGQTERAASCLEAERAFLCDHLGRWFPTFCRTVAAAAGTAVYRLLALAGERAVVAELALRGIEPAPLPLRRRTAVEGDQMRCG